MTREDVVRKIKALQARTVDRGCSEAEALSAARMVGKLLGEHGLAMSDLEIKETICEDGLVETGRKRWHEINSCVVAIGVFTDCKVWRSADEGFVYHFFGLPEDVAAAKWLYSMVLASMAQELVNFKAMSWFDDLPTGRRQSHSFLLGMARRINARLREMKREQKCEMVETTGRDLVVVKGAVVMEQFAKLGINLQRSRGQSYSGDGQAYDAGSAAGDKVGFNKGLGRERKMIR